MARLDARNAADEEFEVQTVLAIKFSSTGETHVLVAWKDFPGEDSWEPTSNLSQEILQSHVIGRLFRVV